MAIGCWCWNRCPRAGSRRPTAILVHGLAGCADGNYVVRVRPAACCIWAFAWSCGSTLRGAGEGFGLARQIYHAGRSDDLREVVAGCERRDPGSPIGAIGFSLGANLVLKLAAEAGDAAGTGSRLRVGGQPPHRPGCIAPD